MCAHVRTGTMFHSMTNSEQFGMKATANCETRNVVYLIEYIKCSTQYIGETKNALHMRLTGHRLDTRHKCIEKSVTKHFNLVDHLIKDLTIMMIETIYKKDAKYRKRKESHWIEIIQCLKADELNLYP